jgi:hypothetical protein
LAENAQTFELADGCFNVLVLIDLQENLWQIIVQAKVVLDKARVHTFKLQFFALLTYFAHFFPNDAVPPIALLVPSERLPAAESKIEVERT